MLPNSLPFLRHAAVALALVGLVGSGFAQNPSWINVSPLVGPSARGYPKMVFDSRRNVLVLFGGSGFGDTWEWNGTSWRNVTPAPPAPSPAGRFGHAMAFDSSRNVAVLFGARGLSDTWEWNGKNWTQRPIAGPSAREGHAMAFDFARKVVVLFGGWETGTWGPVADTWERKLSMVHRTTEQSRLTCFHACRGRVHARQRR